MKLFGLSRPNASADAAHSAVTGNIFFFRLVKQLVVSVIVISICSVALIPQAAAYTSVPSYFAAEIANADTQWGIIPESLQSQDLSMQITRGDFCQVVLLAYQQLNGIAPSETEAIYFSDADSSYISSAYRLGIVSGYPDGTFREDNLITRQEIFKMIYNFTIVHDDSPQMRRSEANDILSVFCDSGKLWDWSVIPTAEVVRTGIVKGTESGMLDPYSYSTSAQAITLVSRTLNNAARSSDGHNSYHVQSWGDSNNTASGKPRFLKVTSDTPLTDVGYNDQKYILVFGSVDSPVYQNATEAAVNMVSVPVNVWKLGADGNKTTKTLNLTVNKAISDTIKTIFQEIYQGEEKFPIQYICTYGWRGNTTSQHSQGLAIDINPNENYMIKKDGTIVCGVFWTPGTSPYSIPADGEVVRIFHKYGFAWGGNAWSSSNDYMHFSYFGT